MGNGISLGLTNGTKNYGLAFNTTTVGKTIAAESAYGATIPSNYSGAAYPPNLNNLSVTTDGSKSGLVTSFSNIEIGTITSEKFGSYYIRY